MTPADDDKQLLYLRGLRGKHPRGSPVLYTISGLEPVMSCFHFQFQNALISKGIISNRQAEKTESSFHTLLGQKYLDCFGCEWVTDWQGNYWYKLETSNVSIMIDWIFLLYQLFILKVQEKMPREDALLVFWLMEPGKELVSLHQWSWSLEDHFMFLHLLTYFWEII